MLEGHVSCPPALADRWRRAGYWEDRPLTDILQVAAARWPDKLALIEGERQRSYRELLLEVERLASSLLRSGLNPGDRVVMQLPNSIEFVIAFLAACRIGAIPVMALRAHRYSEIRHFIDSSGATAYMVPGLAHGFDYRTLAAEVQRDCPTLRHVYVLDGPKQNQAAASSQARSPSPALTPAQASLPTQQSLDELLRNNEDAASVARRLSGVSVAATAVTVMLLSGGTTSMSKLIARTHNDYVLNARLCAQAAGFSEQTVFLALLPLGHNYNLASPGMLGTFYFGGTVVIGQGMDAESVFTLVQRHRVSVIAAAVPLITAWLNSDVPAKCDLSSLRIVQNGGARLAPELRQRIRAQWGAFPQEIYGTAEGLINMTRLDDPDDVVLESSGTPVCVDDEIRVVDDEGREVADGEPGELLTRGPYTIHGYYNAAQKNEEAFTRDGFYRMGDYVRRRGRVVYAEGRKKDLINRGGEKISCEEVENLIHRHPKVQQVALVAMPDPVFGEKACAFVVAQPGETLGFTELIDFLKAQRIASFKLPERLELVERFPTSLVGKILKRELRDLVVERLRAEGSAADGQR